MLSYVDKVLVKSASEFFGEVPVKRLTDDQIEEARCYAFRMLGEIVKEYGKPPKGTLEDIFYNRLWEKYL